MLLTKKSQDRRMSAHRLLLTALSASLLAGAAVAENDMDMDMEPGDEGSFAAEAPVITVRDSKGTLEFAALGEVGDFTVSFPEDSGIVLSQDKFGGSSNGSYNLTVTGGETGMWDMTILQEDGTSDILDDVVMVAEVKCDMLCMTGRSKKGYVFAPCGVPLGEGIPDLYGPGSKTNNIEIKFVVCGVPPGTCVDIKRTITRTWSENGVEQGSVTNGDDDPNDNDELNKTDAGGNVSSYDTPGFRPPAPGTPNCTTREYCGNFTEYAEIGGVTIPGSEVEWHSKLEVKAMNGKWTCVSADLGPGHVDF